MNGFSLVCSHEVYINISELFTTYVICLENCSTIPQSKIFLAFKSD